MTSASTASTNANTERCGATATDAAAVAFPHTKDHSVFTDVAATADVQNVTLQPQTLPQGFYW